jgi:hypothetical protein
LGKKILIFILGEIGLLASLRLERGAVSRIAIIKCWESNYALDPVNFLSELSHRQYDWADLNRLIKHNNPLTPAAIFEKIRQNSRVPAEMNPEEAIRASDTHKRERRFTRSGLEASEEGKTRL